MGDSIISWEEEDLIQTIPDMTPGSSGVTLEKLLNYTEPQFSPYFEVGIDTTPRGVQFGNPVILAPFLPYQQQKTSRG